MNPTKTICACGGKKYRTSVRCRACEYESRRSVHEQRATTSRAAALESEQRLLAGQATAEDILRRENLEMRRDLARQAAALNGYRLKDTVENRLVREILEFVEASPYRPVMDRAPRQAPTASDHEMVALLSDAHSAEVVDPDAAMGLVYNSDVCRRRIEYVRDKIVRYRDLRATSYPTRKITVAVNGDMLTGDIHDELTATNDTAIAEALPRMAYTLFDFGWTLSEVVPEVEMIFTGGNHGRLTKKPPFKQKWNNWEYVLGMFVQALARDRFTVTVPKQMVYVHDVLGWKVGLTHGDGVKAQSFAGIPHYALKTKRDALQALLRSLGSPQVDVLCYGHFHQLIYDDGLGFVINGSIIGGTEFSIGTRYAAQPPVQALLTFHPKHGLTDLSRINLAHIV